MKNIKFAILGFGVLGLVGLLMVGGITEGFKHDLVNTVLVLGGLIVPIAMGAMAMKGSMQRWQAGLSLAGFALVFVKLRWWDMIKLFSLLPLGFKLTMIGIVGGLIVSILALVKPEETA